MKILGNYKPARGGHAPGHLRDAFLAAMEIFESWDGGKPEPIVTVGYDDTEIPISKVFGWLWNCSDIMPGSEFDRFIINHERSPHSLAQSRTYGAVARAVLPMMRSCNATK